MSLTYVIPDIHGRLDLLQQALLRIVEHVADRNARVITLGDYVDRGPDSCGVIEFLTAWPFPNLQLVALKGNHEAMMWEACNDLIETERWLENGGDQTIVSYGGCPAATLPRRVVPDHHLRWIEQLSLIHVDVHRVFVHAGVDSRIPLGRQNERTLLWKRYSNGSDAGHGRRHVVHGHQANENAPLVHKARTNLDGMAWRTGRLVVGVFADDQPGGTIEILEVLAAPST